VDVETRWLAQEEAKRQELARLYAQQEEARQDALREEAAQQYGSY
jgi:hypothetical protein